MNHTKPLMTTSATECPTVIRGAWWERSVENRMAPGGNAWGTAKREWLENLNDNLAPQVLHSVISSRVRCSKIYPWVGPSVGPCNVTKDSDMGRSTLDYLGLIANSNQSRTT